MARLENMFFHAHFLHFQPSQNQKNRRGCRGFDMASNAAPAPKYIEIVDSDDEAAPLKQIPAQNVSGGTPATAAGSTYPPLASSSADRLDLTPAQVITNIPSREFQDLEVDENGGDIHSASPLTGASSASAMLLDPVENTSTYNLTTKAVQVQSPPRESNTSRLPIASSPPPTTNLYSGPVPGSDQPIDYAVGIQSSHIPQQLLDLKQRWETNDDDIDDSVEEKSLDIEQEFRTGLVYSSVMMLHAVPSFLDQEEEDEEIHPERPERISHIFDKLKQGGCVARMKRIPIREVKMEEIMLVHQRGMWEGVQRTAFFTSNSLAYQTKMLDKASSLYINEHSARCARLSCGGVIEMCDAVASGRIRNGFAVVRPPGHHAEPDRSMGFCFYNNVAVAARFIKEKYQDECRKILILDWDVHHGNGTQSAFWEDEDVLYISIHRYDDGEFFPGGDGGNYDQVGEGSGLGKNVNIPWKEAHMTDADYMAAFQRIIMPIAQEFAPDMVIISAGFDAADGDRLGLCHVSPKGYAQMTYDLASLADGKLVVALEGGYNLESIANSALSVTQVLLGEAPPPIAPGECASSIANDTFQEVEKMQARYWKSIKHSPYQAIEEEAPGMQIHDISKMMSLHRIYELGQRYNLDALPITLDSRGEEYDMFTGQILCSSGLFEEPHGTIILFAHDAGNLRIEEQGVDVNLQQELGYFLDGSSLVIEWATSKNAALIDVNIPSQLPTIPKAPISSTARRGRNPNQTKHVNQLEAAKRLIKYAWDNAAVMALATRPNAKVILIGLGTATDAILHLVEERNVEACVAGVIQLPGHSILPTIAKNHQEKRAWYWKNSRVFLPYNHVFYTLDAQAKSGKRLGKTIRSG